MLKNVGKYAVGLAAFTLIALSNKTEAKALTLDSEATVAGISVTLDNYYTDNENPEEKLLTLLSNGISSTVPAVTNVVASPYDGIAISQVHDYVNVRSLPSIEGEVVGKLYNNCAATIIEKVGEKGDYWYQIESGDVTGYVAAQFFVTGAEAEAIATEVGTWVATVTGDVLNVRTEPTTESTVYTQVPQGEELYVVEDLGEWIKVEMGSEATAYVFKEFVDLRVDFDKAISLEEERRIEEERLERERAAKEAQEKLEAEQREAEERERQRQQAAEAATKATTSSTTTQDKTYSSAQTVTANSSDLRTAIVTYACQFIGNPYVYGGTSLTNGTDCSGFTSSVYANFGYSIGRSSRDQAANLRTISESELQPGDLVFYADSTGYIYHVAMYIGGGRIVHASSSTTGIITSSMYYRTPYKYCTVLG